MIDASEFFKKQEAFRKELTEVINRHSKENGSDTPDYMLAEYLCACLSAFDSAVNQRGMWHGHHTRVPITALTKDEARQTP